MLRRHGAFFASLTAVGMLLLTACGGHGTSASPSPEAERSAKAGAGDVGGGAMGLSFTSGTAKQNSAPAKTGEWANAPGKPAVKPVQRKWVELSAGRAGNLNPVVVNGAGFTLYRFDKDTASPSRSTCGGKCARTWPPVLVDPKGKIFVEGVEPSAVGVITRADGTHQVTVGGWPVYRFSKDLKPGDTNGQGVDGTWFGVTPDGQKAGQPREDEAAGGASDEPASSAILFDDAGFSDNGASQGVAGEGCQNVARDDVASSISVSGSMKLWTEADCKGWSKVVKGNIADLSALGFDDDVSSVAFG